jgi:DNA-binding response OmpR family regulator
MSFHNLLIVKGHTPAMKTNESKSLLLVEDDPILGEGLMISFKLEGYQIEWGKTLAEGKRLFDAGNFDLIILDIGLPDGPGTDLCRTIRETNPNVAVVFLTAQTDEETVVRGLELGANDFVKKPFSHRELMARVKVLLRPKLILAKEIKAGALIINPEKRVVTFDGREINVNRRQFDILTYFVSRPDQIITRDQLLVYLDQDGAIFDRTVDSHLSQLRKILKTNLVTGVQINSIYGIGYRLEVT